jgi:hypothetical protein
MAYDYLNQSIQSSLLIIPKDNDPFYSPVALGHTGFAFDGTLYDGGVQVAGPIYASWYSEAPGAFRGNLRSFPLAALVLLSKVAMTVLDETQFSLPLWMQFVLADSYGLSNNFNDQIVGWTPQSLTYGGGIIAVGYQPDAGSDNQNIVSVNVDLVQDAIYLYGTAAV